MDAVTVGPDRGEVVLLGEVLQDQVGGLLLHRPVSGEVSDVTDDLSSVEGMGCTGVLQPEVGCGVVPVRGEGGEIETFVSVLQMFLSTPTVAHSGLIRRIMNV